MIGYLDSRLDTAGRQSAKYIHFCEFSLGLTAQLRLVVAPA